MANHYLVISILVFAFLFTIFVSFSDVSMNAASALEDFRKHNHEKMLQSYTAQMNNLYRQCQDSFNTCFHVCKNRCQKDSSCFETDCRECYSYFDACVKNYR